MIPAEVKLDFVQDSLKACMARGDPILCQDPGDVLQFANQVRARWSSNAAHASPVAISRWYDEPLTTQGLQHCGLADQV